MTVVGGGDSAGNTNGAMFIGLPFASSAGDWTDELGTGSGRPWTSWVDTPWCLGQTFTGTGADGLPTDTFTLSGGGNGGSGVAALEWDVDGDATADMSTPVSRGSGLLGRYYNGRTPTGYAALTRIDRAARGDTAHAAVARIGDQHRPVGVDVDRTRPVHERARRRPTVSHRQRIERRRRIGCSGRRGWCSNGHSNGGR